MITVDDTPEPVACTSYVAGTSDFVPCGPLTVARPSVAGLPNGGPEVDSVTFQHWTPSCFTTASQDGPSSSRKSDNETSPFLSFTMIWAPIWKLSPKMAMAPPTLRRSKFCSRSLSVTGLSSNDSTFGSVVGAVSYTHLR